MSDMSITWLVVAIRRSEIAEIQLHSTGGSRHSTRTSNDHLVARVPDSPLITRRILVSVKVRRVMRSEGSHTVAHLESLTAVTRDATISTSILRQSLLRVVYWDQIYDNNFSIYRSLVNIHTRTFTV